MRWRRIDERAEREKVKKVVGFPFWFGAERRDCLRTCASLVGANTASPKRCVGHLRARSPKNHLKNVTGYFDIKIPKSHHQAKVESITYWKTVGSS
jgi:hypothetical protein